MSWPLIAIGDFCLTGSGGTPSRKKPEYYEGDIPWVKSGDLRENIVTEVTEFISELAVAKSSAKIVPQGAILLAMYGATVGRMAILGLGGAATNQAVCNIIPDEEKAFPKYVYYALLDKVPEFLRNAVGGAQPNINQGMIKETKIPLPPLKEQKRIAAILDKADAIRRKRQQAIQLADDFLRSVFLDMFGDPVTNPKGWEVESLGCHLDAIESGTSPKCDTRPAQAGEWGVLKLGAVSYCKYSPSENKAIFHGYEPKLNDEIKEGDFLFTRKNTHELVAAAALVESTPPKLLMPDLIFRLQTKGSLNRFYLWALLTHSGMRKKVQSYASGAAGSMPNISKANLKTIRVPIPPIEVQNQFQAIYQRTSTSNHKVKSSTDLLANQFFSLSQKVFSGQL